MQIGFSRLKGIFTAGMNYKNYERIVSTAKNGTLGNIPNELIGMILKIHPENKAGMIKQAQNGFVQAADVLKNVTKEQIKFVKGLPRPLRLITDEDYAQIQNIKNLCAQAGEALQKTFRNILPKGTEVKLSYLGTGGHANAYKMEFLDNKGLQLFQDRVLKVYKTMDDKIERYLVGENISSPSEAAIKICRNDFRVHGAAAEANSAAMIKRGLGHNLSKTDLIKPDMFDTKNGFAILPFADEFLPAVTKKADLKYLGMFSADFHAGNRHAGRIFDYGQVEMRKGCEDLTDKTVLKYFKKVMNRTNVEERHELLCRYKRLAENPKTPHRDKILKAIELAEKELPK
ncbi:MAG: hypothetical protein LBJ74_03150 [Heliobacteriaceae bacterium]|jgi:hypothetical protein|nr:hypothetical protein [Heliobacteriaceae bacterium]